VKDPDEVKDIKGTMREFLDSEGMHELGELLLIKEAWTSIVGEADAAKTRPYRLEKGRLSVGVASHAWVQELGFRREEIKNLIKEESGVEIREIIFKKINLQ